MAVIDPSTEQGAEITRRLQEEEIIWLTTVRRDGQPQSTPVWFTWDGETFLIYSQPNVQKIRNITGNPRVSLHLNGSDGDVVIVERQAQFDDGAPLADTNSDYTNKYAVQIPALGYTAEGIAQEYSRAIRVTPERLRAW